MKGDMSVQEQEIWAAIRYLDPDDKQKPAKSAASVSVLALALLICLVFVLLRVHAL